MKRGGTWRAEVTGFRRLESGYLHIRGYGPCNWAQPPAWPCEPEALATSIFPEAGEPFRRAVLLENERLLSRRR